ncbi:MAG: HAMP domain-containing histidine kinase [Thaumarchaeota archaeon]|nr:MAG: HAMP domain-containing histidine kinase [Nitrososphaerota archaeon]
MTLPVSETRETIRVLEGVDEVARGTLRFIRNAREKIDVCSDSNGPSVVMGVEASKRLIVDWKDSGKKVRFLTEITRENEKFVKDLAKVIEVRHLDGVTGNFAVSDAPEYIATAVLREAQPATRLIYSNARAIAEQQTYLFEALWKKGIPAEQRIMQLDEGVQPIQTRVLEGDTAIREFMQKMLASPGELIACTEASALEPVYDLLLKRFEDMLANKRVAEDRPAKWLTSIGPEDVPMMQKWAGLGIEIRHISKLPPLNFGCTESEMLVSLERGERAVQRAFVSNDPSSVRHFRSVFDELWRNGIEATKRVDELVRGVERTSVEVIENPQESLRRAWDLIGSSREVLVMFSTPRAFLRQVKVEAFQRLKNVVQSTQARVKILIPQDDQVVAAMEEVRKMVPTVDFRVMNESLKTRISLVIVDRRKSMVFETNDDAKEDLYEAVGLANYTESKSIAASYATIFESIWRQTELYEQLKVHDTLQKDFINIAAHELRTPVQAIINYAELAIADRGQREKYYDRLLNSVKRLQKLTEEILDAARIESGNLRLNNEVFSLTQVVAEVLADEKSGIRNKNLAIVFIPDKRKMEPYGDRARIARVIHNIVGNAAKFTEEGRITVTTRLDEKSEEAMVSVADTGPGIDLGILPKLFTRFVAKSESGTGLGLYLSKSIVEAHGGKIWAENNSGGKGATFYFTIPVSQKRSRQLVSTQTE